MLRVKWHFKSITNASRFMQRVWRGHKGRSLFVNKLEEDHNGKQVRFFTEQAKIVQKYYRGFYSRKYEHDFYARKKYLSHVETKNEEVRRNLDDH